MCRSHLFAEASGRGWDYDWDAEGVDLDCFTDRFMVTTVVVGGALIPNSDNDHQERTMQLKTAYLKDREDSPK